MKSEIIPAILAHTAKEAKEQWAVFEKMKSKMVQVDVCDGKFAGPKTFSADEVKKLKLPAFEVDLMVSNPAEVALEWLLAGASRVIFHIESFDDGQRHPVSGSSPHVVIDLCRLYNKEVGVALSPETSIEKIASILTAVDRVQFKGVHPGQSGQKLLPAVVKKIATFHAEYPKVIIAVDGGVNRETIEVLREAGVSSFAVSSALLDAVDAKKELTTLEKLAQ